LQRLSQLSRSIQGRVAIVTGAALPSLRESAHPRIVNVDGGLTIRNA